MKCRRLQEPVKTVISARIRWIIDLSGIMMLIYELTAVAFGLLITAAFVYKTMVGRAVIAKITHWLER
jgi:hypothetical protein